MSRPGDGDKGPAGGDVRAGSGASELPEPAGQRPVLDWESAVVQMEGREDLLRQLAQTFDTECRGLMEKIEQAVSAGDAKRLRRFAHTLKGSAGIFCAQAAQEAARRLELRADSPSGDDVRQAFEELQRAIAELMPALAARSGTSRSKST